MELVTKTVVLWGFTVRTSYLRDSITQFAERTHTFCAAKHFIIDDIACYIGSQNLYICDLAEWGVLIDDPATTESIKGQYWDPMWKVSYTRDDCDVDLVMDGLKIDRGAPNKYELTKLQYEKAKEKLYADYGAAKEKAFYAQKKRDDGYTSEDDKDDNSSAEDYSEAEC